MKSFTINITPKLENVTFSVNNGRAFSDALMSGIFKKFNIVISPKDLDRVKKFAVKYGNDKSSNRGHWYAHCNGYAMDLVVSYNGTAQINTYRPFGKSFPVS